MYVLYVIDYSMIKRHVFFSYILYLKKNERQRRKYHFINKKYLLDYMTYFLLIIYIVRRYLSQVCSS